MKKKIFGISLVLLTLFNLSALGTIIYNKYFSSPASIQQEKNCISLKDSLNLSENQCGMINHCNYCFKTNTALISHKLKMHRNQLIAFLKSDSTDKNKIGEILSKIDSLQSNLLREVVNNLVSQKEILSQNQREKFFAMILNDMSINNEAKCLNQENPNK